MFGPMWLGVVGYVFEMANIALDPRVRMTPKLLQHHNESIPLVNALNFCFNSTSNSTMIADIQDNILNDDSFTDDMRVTLTYRLLHEAFESDPSLWKACEETEVLDGIRVKHFVQVGQLYQQISRIEEIFSGNGSAIYVLNELEQLEMNSTGRMQSLIKDFGSQLKSEFVETTDPYKRLQVAVDKWLDIAQDNVLASDVTELPLGDWGKICDLVHCQALLRFHGWHWFDPSLDSPCAHALDLLARSEDGATPLTAALLNAYETQLRYARAFEPFLQLVRRQVQERAESSTAELLVHVCRTLSGFSDPGRGRLEEVLAVQVADDLNVLQLCRCVHVQPPVLRSSLPRRQKRWWWPF